MMNFKSIFSNNTKMEKKEFRADLEGLRAIAVVSVVLYHAQPSIFAAGFTGVDIFFFLSGYLICKTITHDHHIGIFSLKQFYRRRALRIFPALAVMLAVVSTCASLILPPNNLKEYAGTLISTLLFSSNLYFFLKTDYFDGLSEFKPLLHTWSLSIEEQFYVIFPILLLALYRWRKTAVSAALIVLALSSFILDLWLIYRHSPAAFYLGPARAFELLSAAVLATRKLRVEAPRSEREAVGILGLCLIAIAVCMPGGWPVFPGFASLVPCLGTAAIIYAGEMGPVWSSRLLSWRPLCLIGGLSYSLYLWHLPILALLRSYYLGAPPQGATMLAVAASFIIAFLSWRFIEFPFRWGAHYGRRIVALACLSAGFTVFAGAYAYLDGGMPWRYSSSALRLFATREDMKATLGSCLGETGAPRHSTQYCVQSTGTALGRIAVWGDSHAIAISFALAQIEAGQATVVRLTHGDCPPALNYNPQQRPECAVHNQRVTDLVLSDSRVKYVILAADYLLYKNDAKFWEGLDHNISQLKAAGKHVIVVYPYPTYPIAVPEALGQYVMRGMPVTSYTQSFAQFKQHGMVETTHLDALIARNHVQIVQSDKLFCFNDTCPPYIDGQVLYVDDHHLSRSGGMRIAAQIDALIRSTGF